MTIKETNSCATILHVAFVLNWPCLFQIDM